MADNVAAKVEFIDAPHEIANKVSKVGPNLITDDLLSRTDKNIIANMGAQYLDWVNDDIQRLEHALSEIEDGADLESEAAKSFRVCIHELRGMGGTFEYDLVTSIGDQMYRIIHNCEAIDAGRVMALRVHLNAIKVVMAEKLTGDGGDRGREVFAGLQQVFQKFS
jgi:hypothetical protein